MVDPKSAEGNFFQGLIQNSAAQLKLICGISSGARDLNQNAQKHLNFVLTSGNCDTQNRFMGIDIRKLIEDIENQSSPPTLNLNL